MSGTEFYEKMVFLNPEKEKEWSNLPPSVKRAILENVYDTVDRKTSEITIEMLCEVINELSERVSNLEKKFSKNEYEQFLAFKERNERYDLKKGKQ